MSRFYWDEGPSAPDESERTRSEPESESSLIGGGGGAKTPAHNAATAQNNHMARQAMCKEPQQSEIYIRHPKNYAYSFMI